MSLESYLTFIKNRNRLCNETNVLFCILLALVIKRSHIRLWSNSFFMWSTSINSSFCYPLSCSFRSTLRIRRVYLSCRLLFLTEGKFAMPNVIKKTQPAWLYVDSYSIVCEFPSSTRSCYLIEPDFYICLLFFSLQFRCHLCDPFNVPERAKLWWSFQEIKREKS
jgi:hypothetical protein